MPNPFFSSAVAIASAIISCASAAATEGTPAYPIPLRVGVSHLTPEPATPAARLYTEEGFETDLARDLAKALGRPVAFEVVAPDDMASALADGRIDAALARGGEGIETGYGSALTVAMRSDTTIRSWNDLEGRTACVSDGNEEALALATRHKARIRKEPVPARSLMRVRTGECDVAIHDAVLLDRLFRQENWQKFSATLQPVGARDLHLSASPATREEFAAALARINAEKPWSRRVERWAANVAFEIYLDQEAPDCH